MKEGGIIKRLFLVLTTIVVLITTSITFPMNNAYAIGPVIKIVGGESLDQIMQGIAFKAGQSFNDEKALDIARGRWNLEGYEKAKAYETQLSQEEKARWDEFNQQVKNAPVVPNPSKPGWGKVILSGAAFLTGLDLVYNAYSAFQLGAGNGVEIARYQGEVGDLSHIPGVYFTKELYANNTRWRYFITFTRENGVVESASYDVPYSMEPVLKTWFASGQNVNYVGVGPATSGFWTGFIISGEGMGIDVGSPGIETVNVDPSSMGVVVPSSVEHLPTIPGTTIPNVSPSTIPNIHPDTVIEIDVPLTPVPKPSPSEVTPLTHEEWQKLIDPNPKPDPDPGTDPDNPDNPDPGTDPNKPIDPNKDPEKPPYPGPGQDPTPETPTYPEETSSTETPSLFGKLWEWLKAILDALFKILNAIIALPFVLLEMLWDFLLDLAKALFVPSDGFWDNNMNELKKIIWGDEMDDMIDDFESLSSGGGGFFKDIVVSLMGVDGLIVIDADSINSILDNIHSWVRGVFYPLLILFNLNSLYKMIRGTSLLEVTRAIAKKEE